MKQEQQQQAQQLYFQTDLSKTEIAGRLGISRRTLHLWIRQNNWEEIKKNGENIPSFLKENCYHVFGTYSTQLLSAGREGQPISVPEVNALYKLSLMINNFKTKGALNESLEAYALLSESIVSKDPQLAKAIQPHIDDCITCHAAQTGARKRSAISRSAPVSEDARREAHLDEEDIREWRSQESKKESTIPPAPAPTGSPENNNALPKAQPQPVPVKVPEKNLRQLLRGTATTGPSKALRPVHTAAA